MVDHQLETEGFAGAFLPVTTLELNLTRDHSSDCASAWGTDSGLAELRCGAQLVRATHGEEILAAEGPITTTRFDDGTLFVQYHPRPVRREALNTDSDARTGGVPQGRSRDRAIVDETTRRETRMEGEMIPGVRKECVCQVASV